MKTKEEIIAYRESVVRFYKPERTDFETVERKAIIMTIDWILDQKLGGEP